MAKLKAGDRIPAFTVPDQDGNPVSSDSLKGRRIILYFYPKDNTPGCTLEACSLRDGREDLRRMGFDVIGISPDTTVSHRKFADKHSLDFTLLSDTDHHLAEAFGVWGEKKFMGRTTTGVLRTTFIIDRDGMIEKIFDKVRTKDHWQQIAEWEAARNK